MPVKIRVLKTVDDKVLCSRRNENVARLAWNKTDRTNEGKILAELLARESPVWVVLGVT